MLRKLHPGIFLPTILLTVMMAWPASAGPAQAPPASMTTFKVVQVIGLEAIQHNTKGKVTISKDNLEFVAGTTKSDLAIASIEDVLTGADSQRMIRGTVGTLSMLAPYGSGRFLSLFRQKIDTLTIEYHDANGGLHGAILTLPEGQAALLKAQMVAAGAKTSISVEDEAKMKAEADKKATEKKQ
jgi:hypothetical protein